MNINVTEAEGGGNLAVLQSEDVEVTWKHDD